MEKVKMDLFLEILGTGLQGLKDAKSQYLLLVTIGNVLTDIPSIAAAMKGFGFTAHLSSLEAGANAKEDDVKSINECKAELLKLLL